MEKAKEQDTEPSLSNHLTSNLKEDHLICLIKFGKKRHLEKMLKDGEIYFNTVDSYTDSNEPERGDLNEGADWIENAQFTSVKVQHPTLGEHIFSPKKNELGKLIQYNFYYLSHSLFAITPNTFSKSDVFQIDQRISEFGDSALMIIKPYELLRNIVTELKRQNVRYEIKGIEYQDLSQSGRIEMNPFIKDIEFAHQNEYRIIIENLSNASRSIHIGSMEDYTVLVDSKSMIETIWKAKRKIKIVEGER